MPKKKKVEVEVEVAQEEEKHENPTDVRPMKAEKILVRSFYDAQKLRIEMNNRINAQVRLGVLDHKWAEKLRERAKELELVEKGLGKDVALLVKESDIWEWLKGVKGCGPGMAGVLISELIGPERFETVSKLWAYCGLHTVEAPEGDRREAPRKRKGQKANWNQFLRAKLIGVLGPGFLKADGSYSNFYEQYKTRLQNRPCGLPPELHKRSEEGKKIPLLPISMCTKLHIHNKAMRYMVKMFLQDLWVEWRTRRGLEVRVPYAEEYLGKKHSAGGEGG